MAQDQVSDDDLRRYGFVNVCKSTSDPLYPCSWLYPILPVSNISNGYEPAMRYMACYLSTHPKPNQTKN